MHEEYDALLYKKINVHGSEISFYSTKIGLAVAATEVGALIGCAPDNSARIFRQAPNEHKIKLSCPHLDTNKSPRRLFVTLEGALPLLNPKQGHKIRALIKAIKRELAVKEKHIVKRAHKQRALALNCSAVELDSGYCVATSTALDYLPE